MSFKKPKLFIFSKVVILHKILTIDQSLVWPFCSLDVLCMLDYSLLYINII